MTALAAPALFSVYPLFFPNLGMGELTIIFVIILILFGPGKLPGVMKSLGDGFRQFKDASSGNNQSNDTTASASTPAASDKPQA